MEKNSLKLTDKNLSIEQLMDLFNIAFSVVGLARHDLLGNSMVPLAYLVGRLSEELDSLAHEKSTLDTENELADHLSDIAKRLQEIGTSTRGLIVLFNKYFGHYTRSGFDNNFISRLQKIIESIRGIHKTSEILVASESSLALEILYPENTLFGIFTELVENAEKHNRQESGCKIFIQWRIGGEKFQCEVHDNGLGIAPTIGQSFYPLDALINRNDVNLTTSGLTILNRIIVLSKGILLFSNSQLLGGTLVHFELPIIGHNQSIDGIDRKA
ncbi:MAG TPA: ATP-binding protein [Pyrinomonadaceae bacterium]|jgi:signal transduction histidine kinase|nr:ATP-binding protein [Pyrinomonadaceae bacterium]